MFYKLVVHCIVYIRNNNRYNKKTRAYFADVKLTTYHGKYTQVCVVAMFKLIK